MKIPVAMIRVKGSLFRNNCDRTISIDESGKSVSNKDDFWDFKKHINYPNLRQNGYSIIFLNKNKVFFCVDRVRTYPLFYTTEAEKLFVSDDASWLKTKTSNSELCAESIIEFYQSGFVTGNKTLYKNIFTLQAGEAISARYTQGIWKLDKKRYFKYFPDSITDKSVSDLLKELDEIFFQIFTSILKRNKNRVFMIPLSGGVDSRLIVNWMKRIGVDNILCYSFGTQNNRDCKKAKEIAQRLGYEWRFVELTKELWLEAYHSSLFKRLKSKFSGYCSLMSNQEFPAIYDMNKKNIIPKNSIFIPGHTGDFISGGHIPDNLYEFHPTSETVVKYIIDKHFSLWKTLRINSRKRILEYLERRVKKQIKIFDIHSHDMTSQVIEYYDWQERQAKFIVQFVSVYKLFDYSFELPLWSKELMDYFLKIPLHLKHNKYLYIKYLKRFDQFGIFGDEKSITNKERRNRRFDHVYRYFYRDCYDWFYKQFLAYYKNDVNYLSPFPYTRIVSSLGLYRNQNSFFVQDYLEELNSGLI
jgi:asparagine synthase (glutamine-hydrolysing)|tara:strand:- start:1508 stop:3091 length:1584 start_codon:yes stop_codon:yes gene_type:complete